MRLFRFDPEVARPISDAGTAFRLCRLLRAFEGEVRVDSAYFAPGDRIGEHPAGLPQLFCVVAGSGWVQTAGAPEKAIVTGQAAYWSPGERHASGSATGMVAIILQSASLDPAAMLPEIGSVEATDGTLPG